MRIIKEKFVIISKTHPIEFIDVDADCTENIEYANLYDTKELAESDRNSFDAFCKDTFEVVPLTLTYEI